MAARISEHHPLRRLFGALTEKSFVELLGWPDPNVTEYVSNLLVEFTHTDQLYQIRNERGERIDTLVDMLYESEVLLEAQSLDREREVHRHIGDFTLFMAGLFPEYLRRLKSASLIYHKDFGWLALLARLLRQAVFRAGFLQRAGTRGGDVVAHLHVAFAAGVLVELVLLVARPIEPRLPS